ncbi:PfkB family carbohydrate kinase [Clostridium neuense]|uniref:PfkB family carbohydrate kinase n=1 Tax=Clostridium neuense TaxID=1728934 RepID=A0ABW8TEA2_9CLOT
MKVVGFGDNVVDRYINKNIMFPGGNAVNFAVYAKKSNVNSAYLGLFGDDAEGKYIKYVLNDLGVDISHCSEINGATTEHCDVNIINGDRVFISDDLRETKVRPIVLSNSEIEYLKEFDLIHSGCYAGVEKEIAKLKDLSSIISFDFSVEDEFRSSEYLKQICPYIDFALFSCEHLSINEIKKFQQKVHNIGVKYVLSTMGVNGQLLYDGENFYEGLVEKITPLDTMGAGDSFFTSFLMSLLNDGWKKNVKLTEDQISNAFKVAAKFSAKVCMINGAFDYGTKII